MIWEWRRELVRRWCGTLRLQWLKPRPSGHGIGETVFRILGRSLNEETGSWGDGQAARGESAAAGAGGAAGGDCRRVGGTRASGGGGTRTRELVQQSGSDAGAQGFGRGADCHAGQISRAGGGDGSTRGKRRAVREAFGAEPWRRPRGAGRRGDSRAAAAGGIHAALRSCLCGGDETN